MLIRNLLGSALIVVATALGLAIGAADAQGKRTVLNVATVPVYAPMEYRETSTNELTGFDVDLMTAIAAKMGVKLNWVDEKATSLLYPWIQTKRADVAISTVQDTPESRAIVSFVDYLQDSSAFYTLQENAANFPDLVCGKRVGAPRSNNRPQLVAKWSEEHCVKAGKPAVIVVGNEGSADGRLQLTQGRIDAVVNNPTGMVYQNQITNGGYVRIGEPFAPFLNGILFSKDDLQLGQEIKNALAAVMADGTYKNLISKYKLPEDSAIKRPMINGEP